MTAEPGALAARMDQIRRRLSMRNYTDSAALLAAVEAVLALHVPREVPSTRICQAHGSGSKWRTSATLGEFRDEANACPDCATTMQTVCANCDCPNDEWPCPTVRAITSKLRAVTFPEEP